MTIVEIESKRTVLEDQKKSIANAANLELQPLQTQIHQLEGKANQIAILATQRISNIDGRLEVLGELAKEFAPAPTPAIPTRADPLGVDLTPKKLAELAA